MPLSIFDKFSNSNVRPQNKKISILAWPTAGLGNHTWVEEWHGSASAEDGQYAEDVWKVYGNASWAPTHGSSKCFCSVKSICLFNRLDLTSKNRFFVSIL